MFYLLLITRLSITTNKLPRLGFLLSLGTIRLRFLVQTDIKLIVRDGCFKVLVKNDTSGTSVNSSTTNNGGTSFRSTTGTTIAAPVRAYRHDLTELSGMFSIHKLLGKGKAVKTVNVVPVTIIHEESTLESLVDTGYARSSSGVVASLEVFGVIIDGGGFGACAGVSCMERQGVAAWLSV